VGTEEGFHHRGNRGAAERTEREKRFHHRGHGEHGGKNERKKEGKKEKTYTEVTESAEFTEKRRKSRSLHYAARRATIWRGREGRAASVGMTKYKEANPRPRHKLRAWGLPDNSNKHTRSPRTEERDSSLRRLRSE